MQGTVDGFNYGLVTPLAAFLMACLGGALGLRCITRSRLVPRSRRPLWLSLGATAIGSGIWTMHFIAMLGFSIREAPVHYDRTTTFASLAVAVVMAGVGVFLVGCWGTSGTPLFTGGTLTGLGVASMHYLGMAAMRFDGDVEYNIGVVVLSVVIAVVASITALWAAGRVRGLWWSMGASMLMGVAVAGMHYVAMTGVTVHLHGSAAPPAGDTAADLIVPMMIGPVVLLLLAGVVVLADPMTVMLRSPAVRPPEDRPGVPAHTLAVSGARRPVPGPRVSDEQVRRAPLSR
jgi:NO-binding membrane sensor protein with MHYT domain